MESTSSTETKTVKVENQLQRKWQSVDWRKAVLSAVALAVVFTIGYHARTPEKPATRSDYNINSGKSDSPGTGETALPLQAQATTAGGVENEKIPQPEAQASAGTGTNSAAKAGESPCIIKGSKSGIYHMPDGAFYERTTKPIACFQTEAEAQAAGFRKSQR